MLFFFSLLSQNEQRNDLYRNRNFERFLKGLRLAPVTLQMSLTLQGRDAAPQVVQPLCSLHLFRTRTTTLHAFGKSSATAALCSIIVTLMKAPPPDPFPKRMGNVHPLPRTVRQWPVLQRGTRPHCQQAAALFTWPNYPGPIGDMAPGKGSGSGDPTVNSGFIANTGTGICQKT